MLRRASVALAVAGVLAATALLDASPSAYAGPPLGCRAFADTPHPAVPPRASPNMLAWGEFHCTSARTLAVQVCAVRLVPDGVQEEPKPIWCVYSRVNVAAGRRTFVPTPAHACTRGFRYISYVRIIGYPWDRGPYGVCRTARTS